jgi:hypothetical protein
VNANEELKGKAMAQYYTCCGKSICGGCVYSVALSGNTETCPFCKAKTIGKTVEEEKEELLERVKVNDAVAIYQLGICYYHGKFSSASKTTQFFISVLFIDYRTLCIITIG